MSRTAPERKTHQGHARGVVLKLHEAAAIHRWLEFLMDDRKFWNPIEAIEAKRAAIEAKAVLGMKMSRQFAEMSEALSGGRRA